MVANFTVGIVGFLLAQTKTNEESLNSKKLSKDKMNTKPDMYAL